MFLCPSKASSATQADQRLIISYDAGENGEGFGVSGSGGGGGGGLGVSGVQLKGAYE